MHLRAIKALKRPTFMTEQVRWSAMVTALMGMVNLLSAITPALSERIHILRDYSPLMVREGGHLTSALAGFSLLILAQGLWRRKRTAWLATIGILALSVVVHLVKGLDYEEAGLAVALALYLWTQRSHFNALSDPPSYLQGLRILAIAFAFTLLYGVLGFYLLDRHFLVQYSLAAALRQTVVMFTEFYDPGLEPLTGFGRYFAGSIYLVGASTLGYALLMLLRPVLTRMPASASERRRATAIVEQFGRSSLARAVLFPDKLYYFSSGGCVIAYATYRRTAVTLGDPIGPAQEIGAAIADFKEFCRRNDWEAAFYQTLPDHLDCYRRAGFKTLCIGHEGIVHLDGFSLAGSANKTMRNSVNRLLKLGYSTTAHKPPLPEPLLRELNAVSDEWLTLVKGSEQRFSVGWFDDDYIRGCQVMAIHAPDDRVVAFANLVPEYQRAEIAIDLMRRRSDVLNGTMETLFVALFQWAQGQGYATFNLGMSALSGVGEEASDPLLERFLHFVYVNVDQFYNFKGLHEFKEKFHPEWSPRYLIYREASTLMGVALTLNHASSGKTIFEEYGLSFRRILP